MAKLKAKCAFIGKVGKDSYGHDTKINFKKHNVNIDHLYTCNDENISSGIAPINVASNGDNTVIIIPGANNYLTTEEVKLAEDKIKNAKMVVGQLELPVALTMEAFKIAKKYNVKTLLNVAPAVKDIPNELYELCDIICPNETELAILTNHQKPPETVDEAISLSKWLLNNKPIQSIITTLGDKGCIYLSKSDDKVIHIPAATLKEKVIDTVGAGDCFVGSLVYFLVHDYDIETSMKYSNQIAGISVTRPGTQTSFPNKDEDELLWIFEKNK